MPRILHFADAHIDMTNYGRHDPETGLPVRVMDFLRSLDTIVDAAIDEKVDLVLFAGDAYKDRNPAQTFQREWGRRIMRLSQAQIPTLLLVGNHDLSPAFGRAHALDPFETLEVPFIRVVDKPEFISSTDLGIPIQIIAIPWISRSGMVAHLDIRSKDLIEVIEELEERISSLIQVWLKDLVDPELPLVLTAHASVQGAQYGGERSVILGQDLVLPGSLVKDPVFDYVALGHIHKPQDLNEGQHPPVIYPGSIERVDFGEAGEGKYFVIADIKRGATSVDWRPLKEIRPFVDRYLLLEDQETLNEQILKALPDPSGLEGAIVRLTLEYPRDWEPLIDEAGLRNHVSSAFEFRLVKRPQMENRVRLPEDQSLGSLSHLDLLELYWKASHTDPADIPTLLEMAKQIIED